MAAGMAAWSLAERSVAMVEVSGRERVAVLAAFAAVYFIWGSTFLAIAWAVETMPPLLMIGARALLAGVVLYGWARLRGGPRPSPADWRAALVAGVLLFVTGQAVLAWAETRIPSGAASLLFATEPLFIVLLGWVGGGLTGAAGVRPGLATIAGIPLGLVGVGVLVLPGVGGGGLDPLGALAAVLASMSWSVGVYRAAPRPGLGPGQVAGMQLLMAGVVLFVVSAVVGEPWSVPPGGYGGRAIAAFLYLVVMGSIVAFGAYVWLLERVGPSRLSSHAYVNPLVAVALGIGLNAEPVTAGLVLATVLILASVALLLRRGAAGPRRLNLHDETQTNGRQGDEESRRQGRSLGRWLGQHRAARRVRLPRPRPRRTSAERLLKHWSVWRQYRRER